MNYVQTLNRALHTVLEQDSRVVVMGEDIADPYGGAFKATKGLTTRFPERVFTTPVSEAALAGIAGGLALAGFRPFVEIMFGDFVGLCFDQVVNHIAKYEAMYDGKVHCPVVIRTPFGGGRGYGPTHSQSLEKHFVGIPHLEVFAASLYEDPFNQFSHILGRNAPVLFAEHKLLYPMETRFAAPARGSLEMRRVTSPDGVCTVSLSAVPRSECVATVYAYGYQACMLEEVLERLALEEEIFLELLVPSRIAPVDYTPLFDSVQSTGRLFTVEEGTAGWSWGSEIAMAVSRALFGRLKAPVEVLTSNASLIPSSRVLEEQTLMHARRVEHTIREHFTH